MTHARHALEGPPAPSGASDTRDGLPPGNPMMWLLVASELLVFGAALVYFAVCRAMDPEGFLAAQSELDRLAGALNTSVLITSGLFAALAVEARKSDDRRGARIWLSAAAALGIAFLVVKAREYAVEIGNGHGLDDPGFFGLYFLITGFHAAHVVFGIVILAVVAVFDEVEHVETGALFWHMVDLIWVVVFPCLYLMR